MATAQGVMNNNSVRRRGGRTQDQINKSKFKHAVTLIATIGLIFFAIVEMHAVGAHLQAQNNDLISANANLQAEIDSLNTQIGDATNIGRIEEIATDKLGMVQPTADNYIAVSEEATVDEDLAVVIKDEAYN